LGSDEAAVIAGHFLDARRLAAGLPDYPGALPETLEEAYAIQDQAIRGLGKTIIGWKIGRILPPLSDRFGVDRLAGPIFASQVALGGHTPEMPVFAAGFAAGEAEYLLRIGQAPPPGQTQFTLDEVAELIDAVHVGIEVASSPLGAINQIGPVAVISDFGNNNGLVIGPARFLFELAARSGIALRPGQWISSGAVTGVHDARPGQLVEARFAPDLVVRCRLSQARPQ
jgi:2-keto-4-pentenoate hydratase